MDPDSEKLDDLSARIRDAEAGKDVGKTEAGQGRNAGFDFVGALAGGGIIGALLDRAFGTSPWCLLGMVLFGFVAGIIGAWRATQSKG